MKEYRVHIGMASKMHEFDSPFEAENYADEMSNKYPSSNVYLDRYFSDAYVTIAKYRNGIQVNGVLYNQFFGND